MIIDIRVFMIGGFKKGKNRWLGEDVYTSLVINHTQRLDMKFLKSFILDKPVVIDIQEWYADMEDQGLTIIVGTIFSYYGYLWL